MTDEQLRRENQLLRKALERYANPDNWSRTRRDGPIDKWICCVLKAWNGPDEAIAALRAVGVDTEEVRNG